MLILFCYLGNSTPGVLAKLAQSVRRVATAGPRSLQAANTMLLPQYQQQQHLHAYYFDDAEDVDDDHNIHASLLSVCALLFILSLWFVCLYYSSSFSLLLLLLFLLSVFLTIFSLLLSFFLP